MFGDYMYINNVVQEMCILIVNVQGMLMYVYRDVDMNSEGDIDVCLGDVDLCLGVLI